MGNHSLVNLRLQHLVILLSILLALGCETGKSEPPMEPSTQVLETPPIVIPGPVVAPLGSVTVPPNIFEASLPAYTPGPASRPAQRLLDKAKDEWALSHRDQAFALLDRAFRIDSQSAEISLRHSQAYFETGQYQKAENWARRAIGNSLIAPDQLRLAWHLIARARYRLGDQDGAQKAMEESQQSE